MTIRSLTGQAFYILTALADGPRHGYGIVGEVADLSQGRVKLKIGSLYGVLDRLSSEGLIEPDREEAHERPGCATIYRLTRDGRGALADEADLRAASARVVWARLGLGGAEAAGSRAGPRALEQRYRRVLRLLPGYYRATLGRGHGRHVPGQLADRRTPRPTRPC